jgi:hypothetical protein
MIATFRARARRPSRPGAALIVIVVVPVLMRHSVSAEVINVSGSVLGPTPATITGVFDTSGLGLNQLDATLLGDPPLSPVSLYVFRIVRPLLWNAAVPREGERYWNHWQGNYAGRELFPATASFAAGTVGGQMSYTFVDGARSADSPREIGPLLGYTETWRIYIAERERHTDTLCIGQAAFDDGAGGVTGVEILGLIEGPIHMHGGYGVLTSYNMAPLGPNAWRVTWTAESPEPGPLAFLLLGLIGRRRAAIC